MKMAKASTADMEMAMKLCTALEWLERGDFDSEDAEHCYRAMKEVLGIVRSGSISRVVWGMYVLLDPENKVVDPDADTLEDHPETLATMKDAERYRWLKACNSGSIGIRTIEMDEELARDLVEDEADHAIDAAMDLPANAELCGGPSGPSERAPG